MKRSAIRISASTLTTNGLLLDDDIIDFLNEEMGNVVISLDGRKDVNDNMRKLPDGDGSYDAILPAFKKLAASRGQRDYYVRGTYTHYNTDFASDVIHMADLGFKELSIEPVVAPADAPYALKESDIPKLLSNTNASPARCWSASAREKAVTSRSTTT